MPVGAQYISLVVACERALRQVCLDDAGYLVPGPRLRPLKDIDDLGDGEIGEHEAARRSIDQCSGGAGRHLGGPTGEVS